MTDSNVETIDAAPGDALVGLFLDPDSTGEVTRRVVFRWRVTTRVPSGVRALTAWCWCDAFEYEADADGGRVQLIERGGRLFDSDGNETTAEAEFAALRNAVAAAAREAAQ